MSLKSERKSRNLFEVYDGTNNDTNVLHKSSSPKAKNVAQMYVQELAAKRE